MCRPLELATCQEGACCPASRQHNTLLHVHDNVVGGLHSPCSTHQQLFSKEILLLECRLSAAEAAPMDPQGRLLLEQSALSLRDASLRLEQDLDPKTGVYVGVMHMEFIQYMNGERLHLPACATCMV